MMLSRLLFLHFMAEVFCLSSTTDQTAAAPLEVLQIERPLRQSYEGASCSQVIVQHNFASSYKNPYVGLYEPPSNCTFNRSIFNLTITSNGTNYDRLALLFLSDTEVWRFSTAMPTRAGIYSSFQKDMTIFDSLLRFPQKIILSLDNIFDSVFTGAFNVTITSLHFNSPSTPISPASQILPISSFSSAENQSSVLSLPDDNATVALTFPRSTKNAVVSILASGNGDEEFWYRKGVPNSYVNTFNNSELHGFSSFREIQLLIDDNLAGVSWPFPIVFTGGINPGLWRPLVGIDVYDLPTFEIDISPWLGILCDGKEHIFQLKAVSFDTEEMGLGTVGENWWVTAAVFIWTDEGGNQTLGKSPKISASDPTFQFHVDLLTSTNASGTFNTSLGVSLQAQRSLTISADITTSSGTETKLWSQGLTYSNVQNLSALGYENALQQATKGVSTFSSGSNTFHYPINTYTVNKNPNSTATNLSYLLGSIDRTLQTTGISILPFLTGTNREDQTLVTRQNGSCVYYWNNVYYEDAGAIDPQAGSIGATSQWYSYTGEDGEYGRIVKALDGLDDYERVASDEGFQHVIDVPPTSEIPGEDL